MVLYSTSGDRNVPRSALAGCLPAGRQGRGASLTGDAPTARSFKGDRSPSRPHREGTALIGKLEADLR